MPLDLEAVEQGERIWRRRRRSAGAVTTDRPSPARRPTAIGPINAAEFGRAGAANGHATGGHATGGHMGHIAGGIRGRARTLRASALVQSALARTAALTHIARDAGVRVGDMLRPAGDLLRPLTDAWSRNRPRLGFKSLYWRILAANLTGFTVMLIGILVLSVQQDWLIEAKRESIQAQAQVIADAIVREATADDGPMRFPDPDRLLDADASRPLDARPYDIQDFEFAIQPEKVAPILQRYSQSSGQRARIYARDGTMIYDSSTLSSRITKNELAPVGIGGLPIVQNFWTRLDSMFMPSNLPIYKEIGRANGMAYAEVSMALQGQATPLLLVNSRGSHIVSVAVPIQRMRAVQGALLLSTREGDIDGIRRKERHLVTWVFGIALAATALTALLLASTIARPMRKLAEAAISVKRNIKTAKDLPTFPDHRDEIGQMASAFKDMTSALYRRIELSEKFAADVAHELRNPVTAVRGSTQVLSTVTSESDRDELIRNTQKDLARLDKLITDISKFSRLDGERTLQEAEPVRLDRLLRGITGAFNDMLARADGDTPILVELEDGAPMVVIGHEGQLGQVLTNLLENALSFSPPHGRVWVKARHVDDGIEIVVEDEGPGIPDESLEKVFERFYTDRPDSEETRGKNSGLGLSISREIVEAHAGRLWAENRAAEIRRGTGDVTHESGANKPNGAVAAPAGARLVVRLPIGKL